MAKLTIEVKRKNKKWEFDPIKPIPNGASVKKNGNIDLAGVTTSIDIQWQIKQKGYRFKPLKSQYGPIIILADDGSNDDEFSDPVFVKGMRRKAIVVFDENDDETNPNFTYILLTNKGPIHPRITNRGPGVGGGMKPRKGSKRKKKK